MRHRLVLAVALVALATALGTGAASGGNVIGPMVVVPGQVPAGGTFTVSGGGCTPASSTDVGDAALLSPMVSVHVAFSPTPVDVTVAPAGDGTWSVQVTVPAGTGDGAYAVTGQCDDGGLSPTEVDAAEVFPYLPASITVATPADAVAPAATQVAAQPVTAG